MPSCTHVFAFRRMGAEWTPNRHHQDRQKVVLSWSFLEPGARIELATS
jgi:hypothetical protein